MDGLNVFIVQERGDADADLINVLTLYSTDYSPASSRRGQRVCHKKPKKISASYCEDIIP